MSKDQLSPVARSGPPDMPVVILSTSHMRMCGPSAVEHERRHSGAGLAQPSSSHRRQSYTVGQRSKTPTIMEEGRDDKDWVFDLDVSLEEDAPVVRVVHHASRQFAQQQQSSQRPASAGGASAHRSSYVTLCSPRFRTPSPMSRPGTPIARPMSPMVRTLTPQQAAKLASVMPPKSEGRPSPGAHTTEIVARRSGQSRSRFGTSPHPQSPSSTRTHPSGSMMVRIYEEFVDDDDAALARREHNATGRQENMEVAVPASWPFRRRSSAAAAIAAAAVSAAALEAGIDSVNPEPCLDCLEEFVRRKRAVHGGTSSEKSSESTEKVDKAHKSQHPAPAHSSPPHHDKKASKASHDHSTGPASKASHDHSTGPASKASHGHAPGPASKASHDHSTGPASKASHGHSTGPAPKASHDRSTGTASSPHGHASSHPGGAGAHATDSSSSMHTTTPPSKASEIRCPACKACKSCGNIWPLPGKK